MATGSWPLWKKRSTLGEVHWSQPFKRGTALCQSRMDRFRVPSLGFNHKVDVFGGAWLRVKRYGVPPDNQVLNAVGVEAGQ
jgi:hypothetical protein